jgi:hypothetical protein
MNKENNSDKKDVSKLIIKYLFLRKGVPCELEVKMRKS